MRRVGEVDGDGVTRADFAIGHDDGHDARLADERAMFVAVEDGGHQPRLEVVKLVAGVAQAGNLNNSRGAQA